MLPQKPGSEAGKRLKAAREALRLSTRDVARLSNELAIYRKNPEYYVSHTSVADIEAGKFKPNLYKLHCLSLLYRLRFNEILSQFGFDVRSGKREPEIVNLPHTYLVKPDLLNAHRTIIAPIQPHGNVDLERTNLVSRMFASWGEVPVELLEQMNHHQSLCGYIGTKDCMLYPVIRPGSFVQIDPRQTGISSSWRNDFDRPIYFVELHDGYVCSWCELQGKKLILIPTSQSQERARHLRFPAEADIVGRVTAVMMRIAEPSRLP